MENEETKKHEGEVEATVENTEVETSPDAEVVADEAAAEETSVDESPAEAEEASAE